jgi:hypothetical protein
MTDQPSETPADPGPPDSGVAGGPHGRHRRGHRRLWLAVAAGTIAAVVSGALAVVAIAPWSDDEPSATGTEDPAGPNGSLGEGPSGGDGPETDSRHRPPEESEGDFPTTASTGVPDGVTLTSSGTVQVTENGAVVENLEIVDGIVEVRANDVTVRNVRITNDREFVQWGVVQEVGYSGLVVEDSEIFGNADSPEQFASGVSNHGGMITVRRVEIHTITDGIVASHGLIEDNYLHSPRYFPEDHTDMVQANGGPEGDLSLEIRHNTIINTEDQTGAISLFDNFREVQNVLIEDNLLAGGGYTFYGGGLVAEGADPANIVVRGNTFSRQVWPNSGHWGPVAYFDENAPGNVWDGNVWEDDGSPVILERQD